jgi:hypothetical protein
MPNSRITKVSIGSHREEREPHLGHYGHGSRQELIVLVAIAQPKVGNHCGCRAIEIIGEESA